MTRFKKGYFHFLRDRARILEKTLKISIREALREVELLFLEATKLSKLDLLLSRDANFDKLHFREFENFIRRRLSGEPISYITGVAAFYGLDFFVNQDVLVPRPETEILVDNLLQLATPGKSQRILDLGTGSGVIFISALKNNPSFNAVATDLSAAALTVAKYNAKLYLENEAATEFLQGSWFDPVSGSFDFIVSNPPYVAEFDPCLGDPGLCFEPMSALASGRGGYADLEEILKKSVFYLRPGGWLLLEHGHTQGQRIFELMKQLDFDDVVTIKDLSNKPRVTRGRIGNYSIA